MWSVAAVALVCGVWFAYWFIRDGVPMWVLAMVLVFDVLFAMLVAGALMASKEEKLAERLGASADTIRAVGRVVELSRISTKETGTMHKTRLGLRVAVGAHDAGAREADLEVWVEDALLPQFATGQTVHLLIDPADPSLVAVDRSRTPVQVQ